MSFPSPLRYPGGKMKLAGYMSETIIQNNLQGGTYIEPFAGGANIALQLLYTEYMNDIIINDIDRSIFAFWHSVLYETKRLCKLIETTPITMDVWHEQKKIQNEKDKSDLLSLGFSTFFLNRTNRSGIIRGGVIGGQSQSGRWKMDVRYNKEDLIKRIQKISRYENRIEIYNVDAINFLKTVDSKFTRNTLIYFDPPYFIHGADLYANFYSKSDHELLAKVIKKLDCNWILTYDYVPEILSLYADVEKRKLTLNYTAAKKIKGTELIAFSRGFTIPVGKYSSVVIE